MDGKAVVTAISRREAIRAGAGWFLGTTLAPFAASGEGADDDPLQLWIERNAVRMSLLNQRSGDIDGLIRAIGDARVVMLGEPSHGAGAAFAAKAGVVQLLHERLGFEVLIWESGLIDLQRVDEGLRGDADPVEAAQRGILKIWSASAECRPLFEYAKESHRGTRPLTMAGFDMQLTAAGTLDYFAGELHEFVRTLAPATRGRAEALAEQLLDCFGRLNRYPEALAAKNAELGRAHVAGASMGAAIEAWNQAEGNALRPTAEDMQRLGASAELLQALLGNGDGGAPAGRAGFMVRAIAGLAGYGENLFELYGKHSAEEVARFALTAENRRDRMNAETLRWMIDRAYAGRKLMVWAHNAHVMNAWYGPGFDSVSLQPRSDGMKPMGAWLSGWYGKALYKIAWTTYAGSDGWVGAVPTPVPPAPPGSLEERLHRLGVAEAFLPLRRNGRAPALPGGPVSMRIPKYKVETIADPAQPFDALYFIDKMEPASSV